MKMSDVRKYINAGLSDEQIASIAKTEKKPEGGTDEKNSNSNNGGNDGAESNGEILAAIKALTETIQASNIAGAKNKEPETIDDILGNILFDEKEN